MNLLIFNSKNTFSINFLLLWTLTSTTGIITMHKFKIQWHFPANDVIFPIKIFNRNVSITWLHQLYCRITTSRSSRDMQFSYKDFDFLSFSKKIDSVFQSLLIIIYYMYYYYFNIIINTIWVAINYLL